MSADELNFEFTLSISMTRCITCGINFGVPTSFLQDRKEDQAEFSCPNSHKMIYKTKPYSELESELSKTSKKVTELQRQNTKLIGELDQVSAKLQETQLNTGDETKEKR